jgi:LysM repeat protein
MNNNDSPLIPQGSFLEQKNKGRARVRIAVFVVLAIHGIGLMALLMQGCKPNVPPPETQLQETNVVTTPPFEATNPPTVPEPTVPGPVQTNVQPAPQENTTTAPPTAQGVTEYKIAKGDTLAGIAKTHGVSVKALQDANPGIEPTKLRIGQPIKIPAATTQSPPRAAVPESLNGMQDYVVKSGDTLIKIAGQFGVSVKAIRTANSLTTDRIRVGQHLKIPAKPVPPAFASPGSNATAVAPDTGAATTSNPASTPSR